MNIVTRTRKELDLTRQDQVEKFFAEERSDYVFLVAAKVRGVMVNLEALADFMYMNMVLKIDVIHSPWQNGCKKLEFMGSSSIYPRIVAQPMKESLELEMTSLRESIRLAYEDFLNNPVRVER